MVLSSIFTTARLPGPYVSCASAESSLTPNGTTVESMCNPCRTISTRSQSYHTRRVRKLYIPAVSSCPQQVSDSHFPFNVPVRHFISGPLNVYTRLKSDLRPDNQFITISMHSSTGTSITKPLDPTKASPTEIGMAASVSINFVGLPLVFTGFPRWHCYLPHTVL